MAFDLLGYGTPAFLTPALPRVQGCWVDTLDVGENGYPDDASIEQIGLIGAGQARDWLGAEFVRLGARLPCAHTSSKYEVDPDTGIREMVLRFYTGGWSVCETFINAVMGNFWLRQYWSETHRGGHYVFRVPVALGDGPQQGE